MEEVLGEDELFGEVQADLAITRERERERRRVKYMRERGHELKIQQEYERLTSELALRRGVRASSFPPESRAVGPVPAPICLSIPSLSNGDTAVRHRAR